jgi:serine/threonine-protein kinase SRPK3
MYSILGPLPVELIQREKEMRHWRWHPEIENAKGKLCNNAAEFFGGPFINDGTSFAVLVGFHCYYP